MFCLVAKLFPTANGQIPVFVVGQIISVVKNHLCASKKKCRKKRNRASIRARSARASHAPSLADAFGRHAGRAAHRDQPCQVEC